MLLIVCRELSFVDFFGSKWHDGDEKPFANPRVSEEAMACVADASDATDDLFAPKLANAGLCRRAWDIFWSYRLGNAYPAFSRLSP